MIPQMRARETRRPRGLDGWLASGQELPSPVRHELGRGCHVLFTDSSEECNHEKHERTKSRNGEFFFVLSSFRAFRDCIWHNQAMNKSRKKPADLFHAAHEANLRKAQPLAARMRPHALDEFIG